MKSLRFIFFSTLLLGSLFWSACGDDPLIEPPMETAPTQIACDEFLSGTHTLVDDPQKPVDYVVSCVMDVEAAVTIEPGVVIEFESGAGWYVRPNGSVNAVGTAALPITLQGTSASAGHWRGILFDSNSPSNRLEFVDLAHAGGGTFNANGDEAAVIIWGDARLNIFSTSITNSGSYGISAVYTSSNWSIKESNISGASKAPVLFLVSYLEAFDGTNTFSGNGQDYLIMDLGTAEINTNTSWTRSSVPYLVRSTSTFFKEVSVRSNTLTIEPGTEIFFENGNGITVHDGGTLVAQGTTDSPIIFQGFDPVPGAWSGIYFNDTSTPNRITNAEIRHAGAEKDFAKGGIIMRTNPVVSLSDILFEDIDGCSVFHKSDTQNPNLTTNNLSHMNTQGALCTE